jgi:hypothetical protein
MKDPERQFGRNEVCMLQPPGFVLGSWLAELLSAHAPEAIIPDLMEILSSTGPVSLDELRLRSSGTAEELVAELAALQRHGKVVIEGPHAKLENLSENEIATDSQTTVSLSRRAFTAATRA